MKPSKSSIRVFATFIVLLCACPLLAPNASADSLGPTLSTYAVLAGSQVTNASGGSTEATLITGNLGTWPGTGTLATNVTGFPPGIVTNGTINNPGSAAAAQGELTAAFTFLGGMAVTNSIGAGGLSNNSLGKGVYKVTSSGTFDLTKGSTLTLTGAGVFVFLMSSSLNADSASTVDISHLGAGSSVYWLVPTSTATLGANTDFAGNILSGSSIIFDPGATDLCGRALAKAAVTFAGVGTTKETGESAVEANQVGGSCFLGNVSGTTGGGSGGGLNGGTGGGGTGVPEPATYVLLSAGILCIILLRKRFTMLAAVRASAIAA